jgi:putative glutamine amidotransferase
MTPKIGIPTPTTIDLPYNQRSWPAYANAVTLAGGHPIEIPLTLTPADLESLAATCHGFLLPGSPADVDPTLYDTPRLPACGPQDAPREQTDFALLQHASVTGKPLLGICYGCQSMNVFHGGSLIQDLSPLPVNHSAGASVAIAHSVLIPPNSKLASILADPGTADTTENLSSRPESASFADVAERPAAPPGAPHLDAEMWAAKDPNPQPPHLRLPVNTSHHQSVALLGHNLRIVARCPDDEVIEAIELIPPAEQPKSAECPIRDSLTVTGGEPQRPNEDSVEQPVEQPKMFHVEHSPHRFLLGIQWHPERSYDISPASRALFRALITHAHPNH